MADQATPERTTPGNDEQLRRIGRNLAVRLKTSLVGAARKGADVTEEIIAITTAVEALERKERGE